MSKPPVHFNGRAIVEPNGDGFLLMLPDGSVQRHRTRGEVLKAVKIHFRLNIRKDALNFGFIDWRCGGEAA